MGQAGRVHIDEGVVFGTGGGRDLRCDVYTPPDPPARAPAVVLFHGGAWAGGDRTQLRGYGILLGRAGYLCVAPEYRLAGEASWPAQIEDAKAVVRWLRANATSLGVDPDRIAVQGNSAGGHLALLVAGTPGVGELEGRGGNADVPSHVAAALAIYAPTRLPRVPTDLLTAPEGLDGPPAEEARAAAELASPITHARPGFPPTMLIHGAADDVVPVRASLEMHEALTAAGTPVELHVYPDQPHAFDAQPAFGRRCAEEMVFFLDRFLAGHVGQPV